MKPVSMRDIAKATGVSVMTVSNIMNGRGRSGEDTVQRVLSAANRMGFRKDLFASFASSKRAQGKRKLQVVFDARSRIDEGTEFMHLFRDIYFRLLKRLEEIGGDLIMTDSKSVKHLTAELATADAIIEIDTPSPYLAQIPDARKICVFCEHEGCWSVQPDNESAGLKAAELIAGELACRNVAVISLPTFDQAQRFNSFQRRCFEIAPSMAVERLHADRIPLVKILQEIFTRPQASRPDAMFLLWGNAMFGAFRFCAGEGIQFPGDMKLLGFDNFPFYEWFPVNVSRFHFDHDELADCIFQAVQEISEAKAPRKIVSPAYFIEGETLSRSSAHNQNNHVKEATA